MNNTQAVSVKDKKPMNLTDWLQVILLCMLLGFVITAKIEGHYQEKVIYQDHRGLMLEVSPTCQEELKEAQHKINNNYVETFEEFHGIRMENYTLNS